MLHDRKTNYSIWGERRYHKSPVIKRRTIKYSSALEERLDTHIAYIDRMLAE